MRRDEQSAAGNREDDQFHRLCDLGASRFKFKGVLFALPLGLFLAFQLETRRRDRRLAFVQTGRECRGSPVAAQTGQLVGYLVRARHETNAAGFNGVDGHAGEASGPRVLHKCGASTVPDCPDAEGAVGALA